MTLKCLECNKVARWHVWYKDFSSPTTPPFLPGNIAYNSLCDDHAIEEIRNGRNGWHVACVKLVPDCLLPDDDRTMMPKEEKK